MYTVALLYDSPLHVGGVETHLLSLVQHGDSSRYRWQIIAPVSPEFRTRGNALGAQVVAWEPRHLVDVAALWRLVHILRAQRVDLLHIHSPRAAVLGRVAGRMLGIPVVVTVHLPPYYYIRGQGARARVKRWVYRCLERALNSRATSHLIYVSTRVFKEAVALRLVPPGKTSVVQNGIDLAAYAESGLAMDLEREAEPGSTVMTFVGRLDAQKGVDVLLEAACSLKGEGREWRLWLVGDGPRRMDLETQACRLGLDANVRFLGFRDDIPKLLRESDVFVLPSRYEAMPIAILEAMAAGLPCVVTDVGENAHLVEEGLTGVVVPREDAPALAAALRRLLGDSGLRLRMGQAARDRSLAYSDWRMVRRIQEVYASVLGD